MSSVSPVFYTVVTVRTGLRTQLQWKHLFQNIRSQSFYLRTRVVKGKILVWSSGPYPKTNGEQTWHAKVLFEHHSVTFIAFLTIVNTHPLSTPRSSIQNSV